MVHIFIKMRKTQKWMLYKSLMYAHNLHIELGGLARENVDSDSMIIVDESWTRNGIIDPIDFMHDLNDYYPQVALKKLY